MNANPKWLIGLVKKVDACIFEGDFDGENFIDTPATDRDFSFGLLENAMKNRIEELKKILILKYRLSQSSLVVGSFATIVRELRNLGFKAFR